LGALARQLQPILVQLRRLGNRTRLTLLIGLNPVCGEGGRKLAKKLWLG
jgi:hypothetical protein